MKSGIKFVPVIDWTGSNLSAQVKRFISRLRMKLGKIAHARLGWENPWQLGYATAELWHCARKCEAELFIAHSEQGLWTASKLMDSGRQVGVDMEDWFSEDLLPESRKTRPIRLLRSLECQLLSRASYTACPSQAMSASLAKVYECEAPAVIYNAFPFRDRDMMDGLVKDRANRALPSIYWYSQTLGRGRGLEDLFRALPFLGTPAEVHLRGRLSPQDDDWLREQIPHEWRNRVFTHALVPNAEVLSRINEHDIGFAGELQNCRSRDLTITNKALHYLLGGLAVVASDTSGQKEVAAQAPGAVFLYPAGDAERLAGCLNVLLEAPEQLRAAKAAALAAAEATFCWEKLSGELVANVRSAMKK